MIVVDTSALMAIVLDETRSAACAAALKADDDRSMSAATLAETLIVSEGRRIRREAEMLIEGAAIEIVPVTALTAEHVLAAYRQWGKGFHVAGLNFGDCFAYALAKERGCPLLYVGNDFARTDVRSALA